MKHYIVVILLLLCGVLNNSYGQLRIGNYQEEHLIDSYGLHSIIVDVNGMTDSITLYTYRIYSYKNYMTINGKIGMYIDIVLGESEYESTVSLYRLLNLIEENEYNKSCIEFKISDGYSCRLQNGVIEIEDGYYINKTDVRWALMSVREI